MYYHIRDVVVALGPSTCWIQLDRVPSAWKFEPRTLRRGKLLQVGNVTTPVSQETTYGFDDICSRTTSTQTNASGRRVDNEGQDIRHAPMHGACLVAIDTGSPPHGPRVQVFPCMVHVNLQLLLAVAMCSVHS